MLTLPHIKTTITTIEQANKMAADFIADSSDVCAFDTETDGLHIIKSKPFLFQWGWIADNCIKSYVVDIQRQPKLAKATIALWNKLVTKAKIYLGHNIKYDLHMLTNIKLPYIYENMSDTMFYIRAAHDALTPANGGPPLALKDYAARYITPNAKFHEQAIKRERSEIAKRINAKLCLRLKDCVMPANEKYKSYTIGYLNTVFNDTLADYKNLPTEEARQAYMAWLQNDVPISIRNKVNALVTSDMIPYTWCNRDMVIEYGHLDIYYTLMVYIVTEPVVKARHNERLIEIENTLIMPLYEMERVGFAANKEYLLQAKQAMHDYILERRNVLETYAGRPIKIGQHEVIKTVLQELTQYSTIVESTRDEFLSRIKALYKNENKYPTAVKFIEVLQELRTLEKWYATYIMRFVNDLKENDRLYTTIHQVGTVSGRVTSDFQQFPKDSIKTVDSVELFHPRKLIRTTGGEYNAIIYLDYSQIELRFQALYTILVGHPDLNLCRAYMPYECVDKNGIPFDYNNPDHIKNWDSDWYLKEDTSIKWKPTDVHGATTKAAFDIDESHPDFHRLRYVGKRVNFAKNYGAQYNKIKEMFPEYTDEQNKRIDEAYYKAFPGVKQYHEYCYQRASYAYTENMFGVKYYGLSGHKLINTLVQGSAAYFLKLKEREIYDYCKANNIKTRWQMQIHDELSWEFNINDNPDIIIKFKQMMQDWDDTLVPIVADLEITKGAWSEKEEVELEDVQNYFSS